ncbi:hypothetical protein ISS05_04475 [Candidatus Woesearchaeota archaeon]|nr:hypothetical protein [Candidatus Woesearchaeota archaeon]
MRKLNKKAVSPFIAAVLLVVIAVTIGAVIANWVREYVGGSVEDAATTSSQELKCGFDVDYNIIEVDEMPMVCIDKNDTTNETTIEFMAENTGELDLENFNARIIGSSGIYEHDLNASLLKGVGDKFNFTYNHTEYGDFKQLKLTPYIELKNVDVLCGDHGMIFSAQNVKTCPLFD